MWRDTDPNTYVHWVFETNECSCSDTGYCLVATDDAIECMYGTPFYAHYSTPFNHISYYYGVVSHHRCVLA